jgi:hypothetical protein
MLQAIEILELLLYENHFVALMKNEIIYLFLQFIVVECLQIYER